MKPARKRVLVIQWGRRGGGPHFTLEVAKAFARRPDVQLAVSYNDAGLFADGFAALDCPKHTVDFRPREWLSVHLPAMVWRFRHSFGAFVDSFAPDLVLCCMGHPLNIFAPKLRLKSGTRNYSYVIHDGTSHPGDPNSYLDPLWRIEEAKASQLIVLSGHVGDIVRQRYGHKKPIIELWHPPFPCAAMPLAVGEKLAGGFRLLFFGRIQRYKGLSMLLEACTLLQQRAVKFRLTIVGEGKITGSDRSLIARLDARLVNRFVEEAEIPAIFSDCDCVVLPYIEASQSGVIATALGFGKPIVATPVGGLCEQVKQFKAGVLTSDVSASSLADSLENMAKSGPPSASVFQDQATDWDRWVDQYLAANRGSRVN